MDGRSLERLHDLWVAKIGLTKRLKLFALMRGKPNSSPPPLFLPGESRNRAWRALPVVCKGAESELHSVTAAAAGRDLQQAWAVCVSGDALAEEYRLGRGQNNCQVSGLWVSLNCVQMPLYAKCNQDHGGDGGGESLRCKSGGLPDGLIWLEGMAVLH